MCVEEGLELADGEGARGVEERRIRRRKQPVKRTDGHEERGRLHQVVRRLVHVKEEGEDE
eukprot:scaffold134850_cov35-Tisochrysis_lutea.AAC.2